MIELTLAAAVMAAIVLGDILSPKIYPRVPGGGIHWRAIWRYRLIILHAEGRAITVHYTCARAPARCCCRWRLTITKS